MSAKSSSSLSKLKFVPELYESFHARYMVSFRYVILLILVIFGLGTAAFFGLPRRLNPEIKLSIVTVVTALPGAGPADVESLLTTPLEDKLTGLSGLDTITSTSQDNASVIVMQFNSGVDKEKARTDAQAAVSSVTSLPTDATTPKVEALDFENTPVWQFALTTEGDLPTLMRFTDSLKDTIERTPNIDRVAINGEETQEIQVILNPDKIREFGTNPLVIAGAVQKATQSFPAGTVSTDQSSFSLAIDAQATTVEDVRNIMLSVNNIPVKLGDIARVQTRSKPGVPKNYFATADREGRRSVTFSVFKTSSANIDQTSKAAEQVVRTEIAKFGNQFHVDTISNTGHDIAKQFSDLFGEFRSTIVLVFINLLLFLGLRQALIASATIPLTFLSAFVWMSLFGQTLNFLTLFAFLLALGTSIDDTIVTVSAMTTYYRTGKFTPHQTGILVWRDFIVPIWTTTITTVWAFLPLLITTGILGEFIKPIPMVVAMTMYSSTAVVVLITLPLLIIILKPNLPNRVVLLGKALGFVLTLAIVILISPKSIVLLPIIIIFSVLLLVTFRIRGALTDKFCNLFLCNRYLAPLFKLSSGVLDHGVINTQVLGEKYKNLITRILGSRKGRLLTFVCIVVFALSSYLLVPLGLVKNEFFPRTNQNSIFVSLDMPAGTSLEAVDSESRLIMEKLRQTPRTRAVVTEVGRQIGSNLNTSANSSSTLFTLILTPKEERNISSIDIASSLRQDFSGYQKGKLSVVEESSGPPAGADVQIKLLGADLTVLDGYADKTIDFLKKQPGLLNVDKTIKSGTSKIVFVPDKAKMSAAGLSTDSVGLWLRLMASGFNLDKLKVEGKDRDIVFYLTGSTQTPESIGTLAIPTNTGLSVPLVSLGELRLETSPTVINHEEGKRVVSVTAGVAQGYSGSDANKKLLDFAQSDMGLTTGYEYKTGGVNDENTKSVQSIFRAMGLSALLILTTMVIEFNSFRQAAIILLLIPFAVSGVFVVFGLTGTPLSFPALIGILALFGVVVTNAMFIVEKINQNRKVGMNIKEAIADAGHSRLEPILLTSLTSILGLVPITLADPLWRGLGGAIISGLLFSGIIMLLFIPVAYYAAFQGFGDLYRKHQENKK